MAERLKNREVDGRWTNFLNHRYPYHDPEVGESLLITLAYIIEGAPQLWVTDDQTDITDFNNSTAKTFHEAQKEFVVHHGVLASVISVFKAWENISQEHQSDWCEQNYVDAKSMFQIKEVLQTLKSEVDSCERRASLRSATRVSTSEEENCLDRLAKLLMEDFHDCVYMRWHTGELYLNCATTTCKVLASSDVSMYEQLNAKLPDYMFCLPYIASPKGQHSDTVTTVSVSLVIPEALIRNTGEHGNTKRFPKLHSHTPVKVPLRDLGDTTVLGLAGTSEAISILRKVICDACGEADMPLSIEIHGTGATHSGWKMEIYCPQFQAETVKKTIDEKVRITLGELESDAETRYFPDSDEKLKILIGSGGKAQIVQNGQHLVLVHILTSHPCDELVEYLDDIDTLDSKLYSDFAECGKILEIERSGDYPDETFWGVVWFKYRSSARKAYEMAKDYKLHRCLKLKLVLVDFDAPLYFLKFHWWKAYTVRNKMELYFQKEEDMNRFKEKEPKYEKLHFQYNTSELKLTMSSNSPDAISWQGMFKGEEKKVYPKLVNYSYDVHCGLSEKGLDLLEKGVLGKIKSYFADRDMLEITAHAPRPDATESSGTIHSYSGTGLFEAKFAYSFPGHGRMLEGEVALGPAVYIQFVAPNEVFQKANLEVKAFLDKHEVDVTREKTETGGKRDIITKCGTEELVTRVIALYEKERVDFLKLKKYSRLLKPHVIHLRGEVIASLLADHEQDDQPNFVRIMNETNTVIYVVKQDSAIHVYGEKENVSAVRDKVNTLLIELMTKSETEEIHETAVGTMGKTGKEECPNCDSDVKGSGFRLSLCGHSYCHPCLKDMVLHAIKNKIFPVLCFEDDCTCEVLLVDIDSIMTYYNMSPTNLYVAALESLYTTFNCLTYECPMMYHDYGPDGQGLVNCFTCPLCRVSMCMACCEPHHFGVSCNVHQALKWLDATTRAWIDDNPSTRKLCPNCLKGVEKDVPNLAFCKQCKMFSCWDCQVYGKTYMVIFSHHCIVQDNE